MVCNVPSLLPLVCHAGNAGLLTPVDKDPTLPAGIAGAQFWGFPQLFQAGVPERLSKHLDSLSTSESHLMEAKVVGRRMLLKPV